jgi:hypothetical protein
MPNGLFCRDISIRSGNSYRDTPKHTYHLNIGDEGKLFAGLLAVGADAEQTRNTKSGKTQFRDTLNEHQILWERSTKEDVQGLSHWASSGGLGSTSSKNCRTSDEYLE